MLPAIVQQRGTAAVNKIHPAPQPAGKPAGKAAANRRPAGKVTRLTHAEVVRIGVENDIFTGRLPPGASVDEESLRQRFGVSRTPVREAILQLVHAGLLEKKSRHGATVARLDLRRLVHLFETIAELEGLGARLAARRMTAGERRALQDTHRLSAEAGARGDDDEYAALGRKFHQQIMEGSHNDVLAEITARLAVQLVPYRRFQLRRAGRVNDNQTDHDGIITAIMAGDADAAYEQMKRHGTVQGDVLADYISLTDHPDN